jgi:hypothetical protein
MDGHGLVWCGSGYGQVLESASAFHKMRGVCKLAGGLLASQEVLLHGVIVACVGYCVLEFRCTLEFLCSQFGLWFLFGTRLFAPREVSCLFYLCFRHLFRCFNNSYNIIKLFDIRYRAKTELTNWGYYVPGLILLQMFLYKRSLSNGFCLNILCLM